MSIRKEFFVMALLAVLAFASSASAQDKKSWGVQFGYDPGWQSMSWFSKILPVTLNLEGKDLRIGVIRGNIRGGDWGVEYVKGDLGNSSSITTNPSDFCDSVQHCGLSKTTYNLNDVSLSGPQAHWFKPFVTIKGRAQIGLNSAVGAVWIAGTVEKVEIKDYHDGRKPSVFEKRSTDDAAAAFKDVTSLSFLPLARIDLAVAAIATENIKVKVAVGLVGFPGRSKFNISVGYLF